MWERTEEGNQILIFGSVSARLDAQAKKIQDDLESKNQKVKAVKSVIDKISDNVMSWHISKAETYGEELGRCYN